MARPPSPEPIVQTTFHLYERQLDALRAESLMTGQPMAVIVRRALERELQAAEQEPSAE